MSVEARHVSKIRASCREPSTIDANGIEWPDQRTDRERVGDNGPEPVTSYTGVEIPPASHARWMAEALNLAREAAERGDIPVGAVVVLDGRLVGRGANRTEAWQDPTAHAEILALREAARELGSWRLLGATLYATLEPCAMCAGACVLSRIERLVYGADDPKAGMCGSLANLATDPRLNHRIEVVRGVAAPEAGELLRGFFRSRREPSPAASRDQESVQEDDRHGEGEDMDPGPGLEEQAQKPQDQQNDEARPEHGPLT